MDSFTESALDVIIRYDDGRGASREEYKRYTKIAKIIMWTMVKKKIRTTNNADGRNAKYQRLMSWHKQW